MERLIMIMALFSGTPEIKCNYEGSQREMNACAIRDLKVAERALSAAFSEVLSSRSAVDQDKLRAEQAAWKKSRALECDKKKGEGTNSTISYLTCMEDFAKARIQTLVNGRL